MPVTSGDLVTEITLNYGNIGNIRYFATENSFHKANDSFLSLS